jgi:flagellar protein FliS
MARRLSKAYLLTKVLTASKQEVVAYLYEGAIGYLHRAAEALKNPRPARACEMIDRAISIVIELSGNLNYSAGDPQLALRLDTIYNYLIETLTLAKVREDLEALEACEGILVVLHDAWRQAVQLTRSDANQIDARLQISA